MAKSVTLTQLRADCRLWADLREESGTNQLINDTELDRLINLSISDLYDVLVAARGHEYYQDEDTISVVSGTSRYNLPATFYELLSLTLEWSTDDHEIVSSYDRVCERAVFNNYATWGNGAMKAYRLRGSQIELLPTPTSSVTGRLQFVPVYTTLSSPTDTFDGVNGWEKLVAYDVAMSIRTIQELDVGPDLERRYQRALEKIEALAAQRSVEGPPVVANVYPEGRVTRPLYPTGWTS